MTENGCGDPDQINDHARIDDHARIQYFRSHLRAVHRAIADGLDVKGNWVWSIQDNFEWSYGYSKRFGLVHVNYETLKPTLKLSAKWFKQVFTTAEFRERQSKALFLSCFG